jgi:hypothetical protein
MKITVSRIAPAFELSLGEEDGHLFAALMWPLEFGGIPFQDEAIAVMVPTGFVLVDSEGTFGIAFLGLADEALRDFRASQVTLMRALDDDYETMSVVHCKDCGKYAFDYPTDVAA